MRIRSSNFLCALLFSVALITDFNLRGTTIPDKETLKDDLAPLRAAVEPNSLVGEKAVEHLKSTGQYDSLSAAITGAFYGVKTHPEQKQSAAAANPAHGIFSTFTSEGMRLRIRTGSQADTPVHSVNWRLQSLGYGAAQRSVPAGVLKTEGARVELARTTPRLTEWFQNTPAGLEHGFTLPERPSPNPQSEPLRLVLAVTGDLAPEADATGQNLTLRDAAGRAVVHYAKLKVWDAAGMELPATMRTGTGCVILAVNEAAARYPLTIDPTFTQQAYLKANNAGTYDLFGSSVAVSGDTVVVGARFEESNATGVNGDGSNNSANNSGAAYVFVRSGTILEPVWTQQAYLKASNTGADDLFGRSVAVSGNTVVVGAVGEDSNAIGVNGDGSNNSSVNSGAAYVFVRSGTIWHQRAYLKASNTEATDGFGVSVAVSGNTVVVGASSEGSNATGSNGDGGNNNARRSGAAYVFVGHPFIDSWSQQAYLKASNTGVDDAFGISVAVSGNTLVVGAYGEDSNATGVNGNGSNESATDSGAAYVFARSGTTWTQQAYLKASNTGAGDLFGWSVAVSGDTVVAGAYSEDSDATGVNGDGSNNNAQDSGAAYVFVRSLSAAIWNQRAYLKASNTGPGDNFGNSVAAGVSVVIGARSEASNAIGINGNPSDNSAPNSGAAYVFVRGGTVAIPSFTFRDYLKASDTEFGSFFGESVAVSGNTVVVGADNADAAYIFEGTAPDIAVEQPLNTDLADGGSQEFVAFNGNNPSLTFTVKNSGNENLTGLNITTDGPDATMFTVTVSPTAPVAPGSNTTFTVRFAPTSSGAKTAALHMASNDPNENPFDIVLQGFTLTLTQDTDGDGINDVSEFQMRDWGFDWKVGQPALVANLLSQVQALKVDAPLISKDPATGLFTLTIGVQKSIDLIQFNPFPMTAPQTTINEQGKLKVQFNSPDGAAFFRLESQ